jgi:hypothetical protein
MYVLASQDCTNNFPNALLAAGAVGFLGPVTCSYFFAYTWWITWFLLLNLLLVLFLVSSNKLHTFRAGMLGLLALATMLVGDMANTYFAGKHLGLPSATRDRANTMLAGAIVASIGLYPMIALIGFVDEKEEMALPTGEPTGDTYGGRYQSKPGEAAYNPAFEPEQ